MNEKDRLETVRLTPQLLSGNSVSVVPAEFSYASGKTFRGVAKIFKHRASAQKEEKILSRLAGEADIESAKVLDVVAAAEIGMREDDTVLLESQLEGTPLAYHEPPMNLAEVQERSRNLFAQLRVVGTDESLIAENIAYCGDISPGNVMMTRRNFSIVDWGTRLGAGDETETYTKRYVAPEVISEDHTEPIYLVQADIYSLGCVLARALVGMDAYDNLVPRSEDKANFLTFEKVQPRLDSSVHGFFRLVLAPNSLDRSPDGAQTADEHYQRLELLFRGFQ